MTAPRARVVPIQALCRRSPGDRSPGTRPLQVALPPRSDLAAPRMPPSGALLPAGPAHPAAVPTAVPSPEVAT
jgi:hypothetical protein